MIRGPPQASQWSSSSLSKSGKYLTSALLVCGCGGVGELGAQHLGAVRTEPGQENGGGSVYPGNARRVKRFFLGPDQA